MIDVLKSKVSDNLFYLVTCDGVAALIDPIDSATAIDAVKRSGAELQYVLNTHFHHDHIDGNDAVFAAFPDATLVAGADSNRIPNVDRSVGNGDRVALGGSEFVVHDTPGHTPGHVAFLWDEEGVRHLFVGDALFAAGAGNCKFGGDPTTLFETFRDVLSTFDDETFFYPGHDYAVRNLEFAASFQNSAALTAALESARSPGPTIWTFGEDRAVNPFTRFSDPALLDVLSSRHHDLFETTRGASQTDDEAVFKTLRSLRNHW